MKTKLLAMAGVLPFAIACTSYSVRFTPEGCNPQYGTAEKTPAGDGFESGNVDRIFFDLDGHIYPDPKKVTISDEGLRAAGDCVCDYLRGRYEPEAIAAEFARRISEQCLGSRATLVVLIHGCNNSYPEARRSYKLARMCISQAFPNRRFTFLEVYWDARSGNPLGLWGRARETSKWVGLGLRPLLRGIDPAIPVRVITHSRGAAVICSALWDVELREDRESGERFAAAQKARPAPAHPDTRLGLIVPAMPEEDFDKGATAGIDRVIVGLNQDDPAVSKSPIPANWCGGTEVGCSPDAFKYVEAALNGPRKVAFLVDLSASGVHDFKDYLMRPAFEEQLLPRLFEEADDKPALIAGKE